MCQGGDGKMKTEYQYIHFVVVKVLPKTSVWNCYNTKSGDMLGVVKWHPSWRQYCFFPVVDTLFNVGCMNDVIHFITQLKNKGDA